MNDDVPDTAITAAALAAVHARHDDEDEFRKDVEEDRDLMFLDTVAALTAAAPLIVAAERERCQALIRDLAASWRDSAIKAPDPDVAAEFEYVASSVDAAADLLDGA